MKRAWWSCHIILGKSTHACLHLSTNPGSVREVWRTWSKHVILGGHFSKDTRAASCFRRRYSCVYHVGGGHTYSYSCCLGGRHSRDALDAPTRRRGPVLKARYFVHTCTVILLLFFYAASGTGGETQCSARVPLERVGTYARPTSKRLNARQAYLQSKSPR